MKVDRNEFARTVGILDYPVVTAMTAIGIILCFCIGLEEYSVGHTFALGYMVFVYAVQVALVMALPKEVEVRIVEFGRYEEMGDFGSCYSIPLCTVHYRNRNDIKTITRINNPKGSTRATLAKWRNRIKEIES